MVKRAMDKETKPYSVTEGDLPVIVSMPHNGQLIPESIAENMTQAALSIKDTDWHLDRLYDFLDPEITVLVPKYSRYVIDLNRSTDGRSLYPGQDTTELCPTTTFAKEAIYKNKTPTETEIKERIQEYWQPYHDELINQINRLKAKHEKILLFEAHSIASEVPRFFEGKLPDFNWGTDSGKTLSKEFVQQIEQHDFSQYSTIQNGRFKGGYITRHYAKPEQGIYSLQLELSQATYMNEAELEYLPQKAAQVAPHIESIIKRLMQCLTQ